MANASGIMINAFTEITHRLSIVGVIWQILALNVRKAMVLLGVMANVCGKITNVSMKMIMRLQPLPQQVSQPVLQLVIQVLLQLEILLLFPQGLPLSPILLSAAVVILQQLVLSVPKEMAPLGVMANASGIMINAFMEITHRLSIVGVIWQILALNVRK